MKIPVTIATILVLAAVLGAQEKRPVKIDDFEGELSGWVAMKADENGLAEDGEATLAITHEPALVKAGKGSLSYGFTVEPKVARILVLKSPPDLTGMKSLHLWVRCDKATAIVISLSESGGGTYQTSATVAAGAWQEVSVNLDEFVLDDPSKDPNGKLDLDQVTSIQILDVGTYLVNFLPGIKGPRKIWLDDFTFSPVAAPVTSGRTQVTKVVPVFLVDNFETSVVRWFPLSVEFGETPKFNLFDAAVTIDREAPPGGGKQSLRFAYPRREKKAHGLMRNVEKIDLSLATGLDLWLKTSHDGTFIVSLEEKGGARYQKMMELKSAEGWKSVSLPLTEFTLAEDSKDDNGKLDADQLKQISIADISSLAGGAETDENRLWIDTVQFTLSR
jgi:hypothetical protein